MRNVDLDPLWRTSIGFDRILDLMQQIGRSDAEAAYPPYNIERTGEDRYRITVAAAGFTPEQISVTVEQNTLVISGRLEEGREDAEYLYRGIAARPFQRRFSLADYVEVTEARFADGLLEVELERRLPDSMKPRKIEIRTGPAEVRGGKVQSIADARAA